MLYPHRYMLTALILSTLVPLAYSGERGKSDQSPRGPSDAVLAARMEGQVAKTNRTMASLMRSAARNAGVSIVVENIVMATQSDDGGFEPATLVGAVIQGFEDVPATKLPIGVDAMFVYISVPAWVGIQPGFYTVRVTASPVPGDVGEFVEARVQFLDAGGDEAMSVPGEVFIDSLTLPPNRPAGPSDPGGGLEDCFMTIHASCPNGWKFWTTFEVATCLAIPDG